MPRWREAEDARSVARQGGDEAAGQTETARSSEPERKKAARDHWADLHAEVVGSRLCRRCGACVVTCPRSVLGYRDTSPVPGGPTTAASPRVRWRAAVRAPRATAGSRFLSARLAPSHVSGARRARASAPRPDLSAAGLGLDGWTVDLVRSPLARAWIALMLAEGLLESRDLGQFPQAERLMQRLAEVQRERPGTHGLLKPAEAG